MTRLWHSQGMRKSVTVRFQGDTSAESLERLEELVGKRVAELASTASAPADGGALVAEDIAVVRDKDTTSLGCIEVVHVAAEHWLTVDKYVSDALAGLGFEIVERVERA